MKFTSFFLSALCVLLLAGNAQAEYKTFGPDGAKFKVDVPQGWTAKANDGGAQITSADESTSLSIQVQPSSGKSAKELATAIGDQLKNSGYNIVNLEEENSNQVTLYSEMNGVRVATLIIVDGDKFVAITMAGKDGDGMKKIIDSLQDAE